MFPLGFALSQASKSRGFEHSDQLRPNILWFRQISWYERGSHHCVTTRHRGWCIRMCWCFGMFWHVLSLDILNFQVSHRQSNSQNLTATLTLPYEGLLSLSRQLGGFWVDLVQILKHHPTFWPVGDLNSPTCMNGPEARSESFVAHKIFMGDLGRFSQNLFVVTSQTYCCRVISWAWFHHDL
jgi:hypothetical protein